MICEAASEPILLPGLHLEQFVFSSSHRLVRPDSIARENSVFFL